MVLHLRDATTVSQKLVEAACQIDGACNVAAFDPLRYDETPLSPVCVHDICLEMFGPSAELTPLEQAELVDLQRLLLSQIRDTAPAKIVQIQRAFHYLVCSPSWQVPCVYPR